MKTSTQQPPPNTERLAKRVAQLRACSRSQAEQYIEGGWVRVNGVVVEEPQFRVSNEEIDIDLDANLMEIRPVTMLLHKPPKHDAMDAQLLSAATHAHTNRTNDTRVLKRHFVKLTGVTPLEIDASGLVVFTQDWRVARKLSEDASVIEQELMVQVAGSVSAEQLRGLHSSVDDAGRAVPATKVSISSSNADSCTLRFAMKGFFRSSLLLL